MVAECITPLTELSLHARRPLTLTLSCASRSGHPNTDLMPPTLLFTPQAPSRTPRLRAAATLITLALLCGATSGASDCAAGKSGATDATGTDCTDCPVGTYAAAKAETCTKCAAGKSVAAGAGKVEGDCAACDAGKFAAEGAACANCAVGTYSKADLTACENCAGKLKTLYPHLAHASIRFPILQHTRECLVSHTHGKELGRHRPQCLVPPVTRRA